MLATNVAYCSVLCMCLVKSKTQMKWICLNKALHQPGNCDLGVMVSIPTHPQAKGCLQGDVLTSKTERHQGRGGVGEGHPQSIDLPDRRRETGHQDNKATGTVFTCFLSDFSLMHHRSWKTNRPTDKHLDVQLPRHKMTEFASSLNQRKCVCVCGTHVYADTVHWCKSCPYWPASSCSSSWSQWFHSQWRRAFWGRTHLTLLSPHSSPPLRTRDLHREHNSKHCFRNNHRHWQLQTQNLS